MYIIYIYIYVIMYVCIYICMYLYKYKHWVHPRRTMQVESVD